MERALKKYWPIFLLPTVIAFMIGFLIPFIEGLYLSFCQFTTVNNAKFIGISNYIKAFTTDSQFATSFWFTFRFAICSVISINVLAFIIALWLTKKFKGNNFLRAVFFMPNLIGGIVLG